MQTLAYHVKNKLCKLHELQYRLMYLYENIKVEVSNWHTLAIDDQQLYSGNIGSFQFTKAFKLRMNLSLFLKLNKPLRSKSMLSSSQLIFLGQIIWQFAFRVESTKDSIIFCISRTWLCYFVGFIFANWKMSENFYKTPWILVARSMHIFMLISLLLASLSFIWTCKIVIKSLGRKKVCSIRKSLK